VGFLMWASWVFLCILHVYLGALFAFLIKFSYLSKKKLHFKQKKLVNFHIYRTILYLHLYMPTILWKHLIYIMYKFFNT
jgi:hypothetical protein